MRWLRADLGDDLMDEAAFGALGPEDMGVKIGTRPSRAAYRVESEREALSVLAFVLRHRTSMGCGGIEKNETQGFEA
jgi:trehalose 6-phosphate phosphatase